MHRSVRRAGILTGTAAAATFLLTAPASAHVSVQPPSAAQGSYATLAFTVPTEKESASTTGVDIAMPRDTPLASVAVEPKAGWTYQITRAPLPGPIRTDDGEVRDAVAHITWTAQDGVGIRRGEADAFTIYAGPLPTTVDRLTFAASQTYSDGSVTHWTDVASPDEPEPDHAAAVLTLTPATDGTPAGAGTRSSPSRTTSTSMSAKSGPSDGLARTIALAALGTAIAALVAAGVAIASTRQRRPQPDAIGSRTPAASARNAQRRGRH